MKVLQLTQWYNDLDCSFMYPVFFCKDFRGMHPYISSGDPHEHSIQPHIHVL